MTHSVRCSVSERMSATSGRVRKFCGVSEGVAGGAQNYVLCRGPAST